MALNLPVEMAGTGDASYWKIVEVHIDVLKNQAWVAIAGYTDKSARDKYPLKWVFKEPINWENGDIPFDLNAILTISYDKVKESPLVLGLDAEDKPQTLSQATDV